MPEVLPVLHQFPYSHFNEKARWALDWKGIPHRRVTHLPGPHAPRIAWLSRQTATPVLSLEGRVIAGSARIVAALDALHPERPLEPVEPAARERALEIQRHYDSEVGPAVRTALFSVLIEEPDYLCWMFSHHSPRWVRALYRATFPLARRMMARANGALDRAQVVRAFEVTERALDSLADEVAGDGQLVGDRFSVADLTCAALLAPVACPEHPDMARPRPFPDPVERFLERWQPHPGCVWVRGQYVRHRPPSCDVRAGRVRAPQAA